ncbi:MAG: hypothetical protein MZV49_12860, partial [Rhodopseudomonas palustris]|nr:hypothetical protein [Rhodopseudomonas palustris]
LSQLGGPGERRKERREPGAVRRARDEHRPGRARTLRRAGPALVGPPRCAQGAARHQRPARGLHRPARPPAGQAGAGRGLRRRDPLGGDGGARGRGDRDRRRRGRAGGGPAALAGERARGGLPAADGRGLRGRGGGRLRRGRLHGAARARARPGRGRRGLRPAGCARRRCRLRHPEPQPQVVSLRDRGGRGPAAARQARHPQLPALRQAGRAAALGGGLGARGARPDRAALQPLHRPLLPRRQHPRELPGALQTRPSNRIPRRVLQNRRIGPSARRAAFGERSIRTSMRASQNRASAGSRPETPFSNDPDRAI